MKRRLIVFGGVLLVLVVAPLIYINLVVYRVKQKADSLCARVISESTSIDQALALAKKLEFETLLVQGDFKGNRGSFSKTNIPDSLEIKNGTLDFVSHAGVQFKASCVLEVKDGKIVQKKTFYLD